MPLLMTLKEVECVIQLLAAFAETFMSRRLCVQNHSQAFKYVKIEVYVTSKVLHFQVKKKLCFLINNAY